MIFLASYAPSGRYVMPTDHMRCLVAWTGDLGALEAVRKLLRAPNDTTINLFDSLVSLGQTSPE